jgi:hypothetical protein
MSTTLTITLNADALFGQLDRGYMQIVYRKHNKQINWRDGPRVHFISRSGGTLVDGVSWSVTPSGVIAYNDILDRSTRDVSALIVMPDGHHYHQTADRLWYLAAERGKWLGPTIEAPWTVPGVTLVGLYRDTAYEIAVALVTNEGVGPLSEPIVWRTPAPRARRVPTSNQKTGVATCLTS